MFRPHINATGLYYCMVSQQRNLWSIRHFNTKIAKPVTCYYKVLNVSTTAIPKDIKASYYQLAKKYHPDSFLSKSDTPPSEEEFNEIDKKFKAITEAYSILSDNGKRKQYDRIIFGESADTPKDFEN